MIDWAIYPIGGLFNFSITLSYLKEREIMAVFEEKNFIAKKIREYRKYAGLTQSELAEKIGVGEKQICKIETGANIPSLVTFFKIIEVLNIDISEFGVQAKFQNNSKREKFANLIYSLNDKELDFYINSISFLKSQYENFLK